jgi:hypothetical protein
MRLIVVDRIQSLSASATGSARVIPPNDFQKDLERHRATSNLVNLPGALTDGYIQSIYVEYSRSGPQSERFVLRRFRWSNVDTRFRASHLA